jgi:hypothetical protein
MASRRLKSDRFLTDCYTEEYYTRTGLKWVADNDMRSVLLRHFPELGKALDGVPNAFVPWKVSASRTTRTTPASATAAAGPHE